MSDSYIQNLFAERIGGVNYGKSTAIYKFEKIKRAKRAAKAAKPGVELIDMGVGEPDEMAFPEVVEALYAAAKNPANRGYADNGGPDFKKAAAGYMKAVFGVELDPETEILHSIGSKAALSILPGCFINPGDIAIMTVPGYPRKISGRGGLQPPAESRKRLSARPRFDSRRRPQKGEGNRRKLSQQPHGSERNPRIFRAPREIREAKQPHSGIRRRVRVAFLRHPRPVNIAGRGR